MNAAEKLFAEQGYHACSLRMIAVECGINQGLIHYHFANKLDLFSQVFLRRAVPLTDERIARLAEARARAKGGRIPIDALIRAYIEPIVRRLQEGPAWQAYLKIHLGLRQNWEFGLELRRQAFGESTRLFLNELERTCTHLSKSAVFLRFNFMVGIYLSVIAELGRVSDHSAGMRVPRDPETLLPQMVAFLVAGFDAAEPKAARRG